MTFTKHGTVYWGYPHWTIVWPWLDLQWYGPEDNPSDAGILVRLCLPLWFDGNSWRGPKLLVWYRPQSWVDRNGGPRWLIESKAW